MLIPLTIPPGVFRNGTDLQSAGRWRDANLVRWKDGVMQPVGGSENDYGSYQFTWLRNEYMGADWMSADHANFTNPSSFYTIVSI